jgi:hypothetical protein
MTRSGVGHPDRMAPSLSSFPKLGLPSVQSTLRRWDQAAGAADATREVPSIRRVAWGSQEVSSELS